MQSYVYGKANAHMTGGSFDGNSVTQANNQAYGGAMVVKSERGHLKTSLNNNAAKATE